MLKGLVVDDGDKCGDEEGEGDIITDVADEDGCAGKARRLR